MLSQLTPLDHHFAAFINKLDGKPCTELWLAAALTSSAVGRGHVCLNLAESAGKEIIPFTPSQNPPTTPPVEPWLEALAACDTVGQPGDYTPMVLDGAGRLYLHRSWQYEQNVANGILSRLEPLAAPPGHLQSLLDRYFPPSAETPDQQRIAALAAVTGRFTVITGGPGTGKTSTVARILALLIDLAGKQPPAIALATPTGKAAMRLRQAIQQAVEKMGLSDPVRTLMPDKVQTIHRLLGVIPEKATFRHNRDNPLACDLLVVDEVSMVDLPLMARLLDAVPENARIILLGDQDQLASVEAGAVLADICNHGVQPSSQLSGSIINLKTSYRFGPDSGIGNLSRLINAGDGPAALDLLQSGRHNDLLWRPLPDAARFENEFTATVRNYFSDYVHATTPESALEQLEQFRVLSPHRQGMYGAENLNRLTEATLGLRRAAGQDWCHRLPVMVTGNNYEMGLFNGDTAVLMNNPGHGRLTAYFPSPEGGLRHISPLRLPAHEIAFALTVHKSQGSEFGGVLLILPEQLSEVLSRELLYTAITRARRKVEIWGSEEVFCRAVQRRIERSSGLRDRLWG